MKRRILFGAAVVAALLAWTPAQATQLGRVESAKKLIGTQVYAQGQRAGELKDLVLDLESGRLLYGLVSIERGGSELIAVPPGAFSHGGEARLTVNADREKLAAGTRFSKDYDAKVGDVEFVKKIHQSFGLSLENWQGTFNNAHRASQLFGMNVKNVSDQPAGEIHDLAIDLESRRLAFVILEAGGILGLGERLYAMPPMAFTLASDDKGLVSSIDKDKLSSAPRWQQNNWERLSDATFAASIYQHYGKQPYWTGQLSPTGRDQSRVYDDDRETDRDRDRRISRDRDDRDRKDWGRDDDRNRGGAVFANVEEVRRLIGMEVRNARNQPLGKLDDMIIDLEAGRVIYAVVDLEGRGGLKAVAPHAFATGADDKSLRLMSDEAKLRAAPAYDRNTAATDARFAARVYSHFNQQHDWFEASRNFANAHRATELITTRVQNAKNENVGRVQNLMVDLPKGRVLYVILAAGPMVGRGDHLFALPPMAFTLGQDRRTLVTSVDRAKLEAAPRFDRANLRELTSASKASEIYRYYGKQGYWSGSDLTPTGRDRGQRRVDDDDRQRRVDDDDRQRRVDQDRQRRVDDNDN